MKKQLFLSVVLLVTAVEVLARKQTTVPSIPSGSNQGPSRNSGVTPPPSGQPTPPAPAPTSGAAAATVKNFSSSSELTDLLAGAIEASGVDISKANTNTAAYQAGMNFVKTGQAQS